MGRYNTLAQIKMQSHNVIYTTVFRRKRQNIRQLNENAGRLLSIAGDAQDIGSNAGLSHCNARCRPITCMSNNILRTAHIPD